MVARPTLLVGAEQSGTTLLRLMLDSHPEIAFAEEFDYAVSLIGEDGSYPSLPDFHRHLGSSQAFASGGFELDRSLDFPDLVNGFLDSRRNGNQSMSIGATFRHHFTKALTLWPDAKLIHLVRDPRDVGPARVAAGLAGNIWHGLDAWIETEDEWEHLELSLDPSQVLTIRFIDLIRDYHSTLHEICMFIGVDYTGQMLDYAADTDYTEPSSFVAGDWRDSLSTRDVQLAETRVGHRLTRLGFEPSGLEPISLTERQLARLLWQDRARRVTQRAGRFGVRLTAADLVARGLQSEPLKQSVQERLEETARARSKKSRSENAKYRTSQ